MKRRNGIAVFVFVLSVGVCMSLPSEAVACRKCGIFGRGCRFAKQQVVVQKVQQVAVQPYAYPQSVVNISNIYPTGSTLYASTVGQVASLQATNPERLALLASKGKDAADAQFTQALRLAETTNVKIAELAKINALTEHLKAGLSSSEDAGQVKQLTLQITQSGSGIRVQQVQQGQPAPGPVQPDSPTEDPPPDPTPAPLPNAPNADNSIVHKKCAQCHGLDKATPQARIYVDAGAALQHETGCRAICILNGLDVPDLMKPLVESLSPEEKDQLIDELKTLIQPRGT